MNDTYDAVPGSIRMLRINEACKRARLGRTSFYDFVREGLLPKPVLISARATAVPERELDAVLAARAGGTAMQSCGTSSRISTPSGRSKLRRCCSATATGGVRRVRPAADPDRKEKTATTRARSRSRRKSR